MNSINHKQVVVGGVVAGLIIKLAEFTFHGLLFRAQTEDALIEAGARMPVTAGMMMQSLIMGLLTGIVALWLYAAIARVNVRGAINGALVVWFLTSFVPSHQMLLSGIFPPMLLFAWIGWSLIAFVLAVAIGAWVYGERRGMVAVSALPHAVVVSALVLASACDDPKEPRTLPQVQSPARHPASFSMAAAIPNECPSGATKWATAVNGNWNDPARWTAGVPTASTPACIDLPGTYVVTVSATDGTVQLPARNLFIGVPGGADQPTVRILIATLITQEDMVVHGRLELASPGGFGGDRTSYAKALGRILIGAGGTLVGTSTGSKVVDAATIENEGTMTIIGATGVVVRASSVIQRGTVSLPGGSLIEIQKRGDAAPDVELAGGSMSIPSNATFRQVGGKLTVSGGALTGTYDVASLEELHLTHDGGGRFDVFGPGFSQPPVLTRLSGVVGTNQHVWMGPRHLTVRTASLTNRGQITVEHVSSLGTLATVFETAPGATMINEGRITLHQGSSASSAVLAGSITNEAGGTITSSGVSSATLNPLRLVNRGTLLLGTQWNVFARIGDPAPEVLIEDGVVTPSPGRYFQTGGTMTVRGGVLNGTLELNTLSELILEHDGGGRFNINGPGFGKPISTTRLTGVVGPNQVVRLGIRHLIVESQNVVNRGHIIVEHVSALATASTVFRSTSSGKITNEGKITLQQGSGATAILAGAVVNETSGVIEANGGGVAGLRATPLVNRGVIRPLSSQINVQADGATPPDIVMEGGKLELTRNYAQLAGEFRFRNGTVTGTRTPTFDRTRFSGFGTWARPLTLTGVGSALAPGASAGRLEITGYYTPSALTTTEIELGGSNPPEYDQVVVNGTARFAGTLSIRLIDGFVPRPCQTFEIFKYTARTSTFASATTPIDIGGGMKLRQVYSGNALILVAYNANGPNVSPTEVEVSVDGETATYDVCIGASSVTDVITIMPEDQVTVDKTTLTFGASQLPQTVTVAAAPGATRENAVISQRASSGLPVANINVRIKGVVPPDTEPPVTAAAATPLPNANGWNRTDVTVELTATDDASGVREIVWALSGAQTGGATVAGDRATVTVTAEGTTRLTYFARDNRGNQETAKTLDVHIDKTPPRLACTATPNEIWPPNNQLVPVAISVTSSESVTFKLTAARSSEPEPNDIVDFVIGTADTNGKLKAARKGNGDGRVYTFEFLGIDRADNTGTAACEVVVPHDRGNGKSSR